MEFQRHEWRAAPSSPRLEAGEVHVWRASLDTAGLDPPRLRSVLSTEELERANRFHFEKDRVQFTAAHGILRDILARYCGVAPGELRFREGSHGKPALTGNGMRGPAEESIDAIRSIEFNMSHSRWMALYAVTSDSRVGVDVEWIRGDIDWKGIAGRFFHENEAAALQRLPGEAGRAGFFRYWTYKESYIKGRGEGLSIPTRSFCVDCQPDGTASVEHVGDDASQDGTTESTAAPGDVRGSGGSMERGMGAERTADDSAAGDSGKGDTMEGGSVAGDSGVGDTAEGNSRAGRSPAVSRWCLVGLDPAPGYVGAVAVETPPARILCYEYLAIE